MCEKKSRLRSIILCEGERHARAASWTPLMLMDEEKAVDFDAVMHASSRLVNSIARRRWKMLSEEQQSQLSVDALVQSCLIRIWKKSPEFDPSRGVPWAAFVAKHAGWAISDYLRAENALSQAHRDTLREVEDIKDQLRQALSREPTAIEVAQALGITEDELSQRERLSIRVSLQTVPEPWRPPDLDQQVFWREILETVEACWGCLDQKDTQRCMAVVLYHVDGWGLKDIALIQGVSTATAQRRVQEGEQRLKQCFEERAWQLEDIR
jgi:RNA polymerase sigma factor (sigma-70 family)